MTTPTGDTKKSQRDNARERARLARESEKKRQRRNRLFLQGGIGVVVVAIVVVVVILIANASHSTAPVSAGDSPRNMKAGGIVFEGKSGSATPLTASRTTASQTPTPAGTVKAGGVPHVVTYIDWSCPICQQFEASYATQLKSLVASGKITLEIHPIAILDTHYLTSGYSTRAANVAACVANFEPDKFLAVQTEFYDHQPKEGTSGLTNAQIVTLVKNANADIPSVTACINNESYKAWVTTTTNRTDSQASLANPAIGGFGTPTVFINGKLWDGTSDLISDINSAS